MSEHEHNTNAPKWDADGQMELPFQESGREGSGSEVYEENETGAEDFYTGKLTPRFTVKEIEEHEDGSATYQIDGSKEDMQILFEAFFLQALIAGIRAAKEETEKFCAEANALEAADKLVRWLDVWEESDDLNYAPDIKAIKNDLKAKLKKAGV
jgi:hypothetical protein